MARVSWWRLARDLRRAIRDDHIATGAAALAFYWMLSLFPAAILLLTVLAYLPIPHLERAIMALVRDALPPDAAALFRGVVESVTSHRRGGLFSLGLGLTAWSSASGIHALMHELNVVWDVAERRSFWRRRTVALLVAFSFGVLIIGAFVLVIFGHAMQRRLGHAVALDRLLLLSLATLRWVVVCAALLLGLALTYHFGPDVDRRFRLLSPGSLLGVIMLVAASAGFQLFVSRVGRFDLTYGSLAAAITLMLWLYLAGWAILLGAELDATLASYRRRR